MEKIRNISSEKIEVKFVDGPNGPLFCVLGSSRVSDSSCTTRVQDKNIVRKEERIGTQGRNFVLFVPPFGEEISLCRRFYSLLRTRLTSAGFDCVQPDLFGTGDSAGNFEEATWDMWLHDLEYVIDEFCLTKNGNDIGNTLSIAAVRSGCLLTQKLLASSTLFKDTVDLKSVVYVQPELNGYDVVNRLFRARITAQRFSGNKAQTSADLWKCIERGEEVLAGGYILGSELCTVLKNTTLDLGATTGFEHQVLLGLEGCAGFQGFTNWENLSITASPFWQSYDTEPEPELISDVFEAIGIPYGRF